MKTLNILLSALILFTFSCKKKEDPETPGNSNTAKIELNYGSVVDFNFVPFNNQQSMPIDSLLNQQGYYIKLREYNIFQSTGFVFDSAFFDMQISSLQDEENITFGTYWLSTKRPNQTWSSSSKGKSEFGMVGYIFCKQSQNPVKGNGIIEFTGTDDFITTQYISRYTDNNIKSTIQID